MHKLRTVTRSQAVLLIIACAIVWAAGIALALVAEIPWRLLGVIAFPLAMAAAIIPARRLRRP